MTGPSVTRVLIADDSDAMRHALGLLVAGHSDLEVVGRARDGFEAVDMANRLEPDVVLMDMRMPGLDGIEASRRLQGRERAIRVVMLTAYVDPSLEEHARAAGVTCYIRKGAPAAELIAAIRAA